MKRIYYFLMVSVLLIACVTLFPTPTPTLEPPAILPAATDPSELPNVLPDITDPSQPITVQAGGTFDIVLDSNPTTGYHWEFVENLDARVVELDGTEYIAQRPILVGSGSVDVWTFRAVNAGDTTILLGYYPPDEGEEPYETLAFTIHVE